MARVLLVGTATLDLVFGLDHFPGADEEMRAQSLRTVRGGNAANTAVVLSQLGHEVEFLGALADAPETFVITDDFARHNIGYTHCPRLPGKPPTSSIYLAGSTRSIVHYRDLPELSAIHIESVDLDRLDWAHFEGRNVAEVERMMKWVREHKPDLFISLELEKPRDNIDALFPLADLLICSRHFARHFGYDNSHEFLRWMRQQAPQACIIAAWGEWGAYALGPSDQLCHAPARPPARVVDTLGAGDTFNAAVIDAAIRGQPVPELLQTACRLAGEKCGRCGFSLD
ncbi:MAG TPA: PfkB family carbohydrate kinase [Methylophilaceae bacterium]|nr:PfkB family carbohydrate kinase [Methylophilaceae bacterium]